MEIVGPGSFCFRLRAIGSYCVRSKCQVMHENNIEGDWDDLTKARDYLVGLKGFDRTPEPPCIYGLSTRKESNISGKEGFG